MVAVMLLALLNSECRSGGASVVRSNVMGRVRELVWISGLSVPRDEYN